jgi:sulfur-carrier protein adenylyltransferase/sulfurtransferase
MGAETAYGDAAMTHTTVEQILDVARWAPSGDNTQPWRFKISGTYQLAVHGFDTRDHCVYDLDGHPSQMSLGALLENIRIAAKAHGLRAMETRRLGSPDTAPVFDIEFVPDTTLGADPLVAHITSRSVQRRAMDTRLLTNEEKAVLEEAVGADYRIVWLQGLGPKLQVARLMFTNAKLRLTMPEAYRVHRDVIEWNARFSEDRIPDQALGADPLTTRLMQWVMGSWQRVQFFNRFLAGTWAPRIQMDFIPSLACGAHCIIAAKHPAQSIDDYINAGRAMQRFWLTATLRGLQLQPEMTPLIFARYIRKQVRFSTNDNLLLLAQVAGQKLEALVGEETSQTAVFMARIGAGPAAAARSTRRSLKSLLIP